MRLWITFNFIYNIWASVDGKESAFNAGDMSSISESGRSPGAGNGYPLQFSCLENSLERGAWWATVHGVTKSWTRLSKLHFHDIWRCTFFLILTSLPIICNIKKKKTSFYQMNRLIMLRLRMFLLDFDGEYLNVTLVFYCCVIYYHKGGSSKRHWSEVQHTVTGLSVQTEVTVTAGCVPIWHQESFLKVMSVLGRISSSQLSH